MSTENQHSPVALDLHQRLVALLEPELTRAQFELVDVTLGGSVLQVLLDRSADHPLGSRIDLDGVSEATKIVDALLEEADPIGEPYTLEVSSPGLERPLRTPAHFQRFVATTVTVKTRPGVPGERRVEGSLQSADSGVDGGIVINGRSIAYADIERARTVFVWGGQPKGATARKPHPKSLAESAEPTSHANTEKPNTQKPNTQKPKTKQLKTPKESQ